MKKLIYFVILILTITTSVSASNFTDVSPADWYAESVDYAYENGLMNGITNNTFAPEVSTTRGMIVTVLYRMAGSPKVEGENSFTDVPKTEYYHSPVTWAVKNRIVTGYSTDIFAPNDKITREQFATIIYRYLNNVGSNVSAKADLSIYEDCLAISDYAKASLSWAVDTGLINGISKNTLLPQGFASRAQAATIFMRLDILLCEYQNNAEKQEDKSETQENSDTSTKPNFNESASVTPNKPQHKPDSTPVTPPNEEKTEQAETDSNMGSWDKLD